VKRHLYPFLVLEYVAGGNLEDWILEDADRRAVLRKREIICGMARALAKAHDQNIYHRDLKPANILLTAPPDVQAKIADFGLGTAKQINTNGSVLGSSAGWQVGTPIYWPPEAQNPLRGEPLDLRPKLMSSQ
jgi:serine/threonine protein kinase